MKMIVCFVFQYLLKLSMKKNCSLVGYPSSLNIIAEYVIENNKQIIAYGYSLGNIKLFDQHPEIFIFGNKSLINKI